MGAAKVRDVLRQLQWDLDGPAPGSVQRWLVDSEEDVLWMFGDVMKATASVAPIVQGAETLEFLKHVGVLICSLGTSQIIIEAAEGHEQLVDLLLNRPRLALVGDPIVFESRSEFARVVEGRFSADEFSHMTRRPADRDELPDWLHSAASELWELLGRQGVENLVLDVHSMLARSSPDEYARIVLGGRLELLTTHGTFGATRDLARLRRSAEAIAERRAREAYRHPWDTNTD